ncbi:MAG: hypothetical protein IMF06_03600 [Proteobacteria bacterium]|nr:hypothetical protein [Pseudomonadota bacterium]
MYRYSVDQAICFTAEDFVLFRESPFACWMERLTLENPGHGIPPDVDSRSPSAAPEPQGDLADTLKAEGKDIISIEWQTDEVIRRTATLAAMRHGVDFIVNGQLAVGPLSDSANLLMRTSGYSELGNYLYIPCDTQLKTTLSSAFRLCFLADLLHSLQGQLPPQMLILRGNCDVVPLQTEDHVYHYLAVKQRFMSAQRSFRKHKMPDPVESSHFGRWSDCANELLKLRALGQPEMPELQAEDECQEEERQQEVSVQLPAAASAQAQSSAYDMDAVAPQFQVRVATSHGGTLAEQARMLSPEPALNIGSGHTADALQNLEFIGSSRVLPTIGETFDVDSPNVEHDKFKSDAAVSAWQEKPAQQEKKPYKEPPPANLRNPANVDMDVMPELENGREKVSIAPFSNSLITNRDS